MKPPPFCIGAVVALLPRNSLVQLASVSNPVAVCIGLVEIEIQGTVIFAIYHGVSVPVCIRAAKDITARRAVELGAVGVNGTESTGLAANEDYTERVGQ